MYLCCSRIPHTRGPVLGQPTLEGFDRSGCDGDEWAFYISSCRYKRMQPRFLQHRNADVMKSSLPGPSKSATYHMGKSAWHQIAWRVPNLYAGLGSFKVQASPWKVCADRSRDDSLKLELELVKGERSAILVSMEVGGLHSIQVKTR